jgi:hypothetical protein|tara:strand:+ start:34 stop:435 length:402 start_codon:yes stop_codon:yes gene_type:complete
MFKNITILVLSSIFLSGCFASSLTLVGTGASASQGRVVQSSISSAFNYGVKQTTGKYPIEHIIIKEKQRLAKKVNNLEKKIIDGSKQKIEPLKDNIKNNINDQLVKINGNLFKVKTFATNNFKHKPRFSYKVR